MSSRLCARATTHSARAARSSPDALGELAAEINALADLLQKQRVRSLEATALLARILEVMHAPLFAFDREDLLQLVNNAGAQLLGRPMPRCFGHSARELGLEDLLPRADQTIHSFRSKSKALALAASQGALSARTAHRTPCCCSPTSASPCRKKNRSRGSA